MTVVVGVDGSGRTHRLRALAEAATGPVWWFTGADDPGHADGRLIFVDDAHRLDRPALRALTGAARSGVPMVISRRPTIDRPELAELDEAVAAGGVEVLGPLGVDDVARLVAGSTGRPVSPEVAASVLEASAGMAAVASAIATAPPGAPPPTLLARIQRRFAVLDRAVVTVARVLALRLDLGDHVIGDAAGVAVPDLAVVLRSLRDEGLLVPDGERMIPAVAEAVLGELPPAERRRIHDAVAGALIAAGTDPVAAAVQLRAARIATPAAAEVYAQAGERLRFTDPAAAVSWFDDAADAGGDPDSLVAGRAEASALLGLPVEVDPFQLGPKAPGNHAGRIALVAGAVTAQHGWTARAAELLQGGTPPGPLLAVPAWVATGRLAEARAALDEPGPAALRRFAEGALAAGDPASALPLLIESAEAIERTAPAVVLPDTPHAIGAVIAVAIGDVALAEHLLGRARSAGVGGAIAEERHRLLLAWARMRSGQYDSALRVLRAPPGAEPLGRERILRAVLAAGIARRRGDIAALREVWSGIEPLLARRTADLWQLEMVEELAVAAARLRQPGRAAPVLDRLEEIVHVLGRPPTWAVALDWIRMHMAIAADDAEAAARVAARMTAVGSGQARQLAAVQWAAVLAGKVVPEEVLSATEELHAAQLPWEASRLAGQAAIRTDDPSVARRLLERARELSEPEAATAATGAGGLSEREVDVARLVLAGSTHREIGAQLYIAPKTVEHHVARIRAKLGAGTRAELLAMLREMLGDQG